MSGISELERVKGIEPSYSAWEADVLPLNYTRTKLTFLVYLKSCRKSRVFCAKRFFLPGHVCFSPALQKLDGKGVVIYAGGNASAGLPGDRGVQGAGEK